jgi:hypothetical protein
LAVVDFLTTDPLGGLKILKHIEGNRFRVIHIDGEPAAEKTIFEVDSSRKVTGMWNESNFKPKVR